jgi:hypothetical protein
MTTAEMKPVANRSRRETKFVRIYYLLTILTGAFLLFFHGRAAFATDLIASVCYIGVTIAFYGSSKPMHRSFSERKR